MRTRSLKFWRFEHHPFADAPLRDDTLDLFVDREDEMWDLEEAVDNRVVGVYGSLGVGKSSFLRQFAANAAELELVVVVVHLPTDAEGHLFREMLAEVLLQHLQGRIRTEASFKLEPSESLRALRGTVAYETAAEMGIAGIESDPESTEQLEQPNRLNEIGARKRLAEMARHLETHVVVVLDDFHSLNLGESATSYFPTLGRLISTIDTNFAGEYISFVLTLDHRFEEEISRARSRNGGEFSFGLGLSIPLHPFSPTVLRELMQRRLAKLDCQIDDFISRDAFYALALCTEGHPRRAFRILAYAMQDVAKKAGGRKNTRRFVQIGNIETAAAKMNESLDTTDLEIIRYLAENGPTSASDPGLGKAVGIGRTSLRPRLETLRDSLSLTFQLMKDGRTQKKLYALPE